MKIYYRWVVIILISFLIGFLRTGILIKKNQEIIPETNAGYIVGLVAYPPSVEGSNQVLITKIDNYNNNLELILPMYPEYHYGDLLQFRQPQQGRFRLYYPEIELIGHDRGNPLIKAIYNFRKLLVTQIQKITNEPNSTLIGGIVLGVRGDLGSDLKDKFREVGLIHIVVASGYNVTVVIGMFSYAFAYFGKRNSSLIALFAIMIYMIMVGFEAPIIRASIMGMSIILATLVGRQGASLLWLLYASIMMITINPENTFSLSFQLSFGATLGILIFGNMFHRLMLFLPGLIREDTATSLAAQMFVLPILALSVGFSSPAVIVVNMLTLWLIPFIMLISLLAVAFSFVNLSMGQLFALPAELVLNYVTWIVDLFS